MKRAAVVPRPAIGLDRRLSVPLHRQLYERLRVAILRGQLAAGARLPSTRSLAHELGISRTTVLVAYEQLRAEGYLEGRVGAGTTVALLPPESLLRAPGPSTGTTSRVRTGTRRSPSRRGALMAQAPNVPSTPPRSGAQAAFRVGVPALDAFPHELWNRLIVRRARRSPRDLVDYQEVGGYLPLRRAIAAHLGVSRGVRCDADQVVVVSGGQSAVDLVARVLLDPGDAAWLEDPGYLGARGALLGAGAEVVGVPVDDQGLDVSAGVELCPTARLAFVTPSHQHPLAVTMSLARRLELLAWAGRANAWIVEDDYDSEYRHAGRPLASLQSLDDDGRVIYVGTFTKVLFPALRIGYVVVPEDLVDAFLAARRFSDACPGALQQATLADFIGEGHFERHLRRMRTLYAGRAAVLSREATRHLDGILELQPPTAGIHVVGWLPSGVDDHMASRSAAAAGVVTRPLSMYRSGRSGRPGLVLGYGYIDEDGITRGVRRLAEALRR
ncbi:PLP-dependent aminotransferase family protein [Pseudonocardia acaciae]|uniref:MocR-like pyridoxine biosynthesis transcription factor PdxR n=1 Tax=Pseudonocardia acaciae TaxID=551276 RepID=UPI000684C51E|nr:PLP-dependent aminotransferase family protein [Pseudonocardia acaciae]